MCLGLPGRIVAVPPGSDLVDVEVAGVVRPIHVGLLDGPWQPGDWILIHSGFALERMTEDEARDARSMLRSLAGGELAHDVDPA
jgi:hydrogenase expression/formation protein HypC